MIKSTLSILLISSLSQAGMFDNIVNSIPSGVTKAIAPQAAESNGLLSSLTDSLGLTSTQATGGTAAIMQYAKSQTSSNDYSSLMKSVPALDGMLNSNSMLGDIAGSVSSLGALNSAFETLGIDPSMIAQFVPIIIKFVGNSGGDESESIISKALSALM